ncbi:prenyltransferase/squalene oxidase repeat-containing protein [Iningainema tapete]|uniref:Squalene cyclase C-terminal domain-containing protein n=1 Tax=Iningainema tapete BLCC-T55 TaxID=2748662 RepID=A0A8J7C806_9CYAN|nr:prenyltransferase/squalene oxidase repeat-containing protein [Iningainema tapete]MBD2773971.1 hypothetical protein [Iningainema tapete BLCC-T55]
MNKATLADSLQIIFPYISSKIATPTTLSRLQTVAKSLAPIPQVGFEVRLGEENTQIDLQQKISSQNNEPKILAEHIAVALSHQEFKHPAWSRIQKLCEVWSDRNSCLHNAITEIWLEFDINESTNQLLIPSIFIGFSQDLNNSEQAFTITKYTIELLWGQPISDSLYSNLERCFTVCTTPTRISHIGVMLSRQIEALRINVSCLSPDKITSYLQTIGYPESTKEIEILVMQLLDIVDDVRLCLDVGSGIYPKVGLECSFRQQYGLEPLWFTLLEDLIARGLCTPEKRDALLKWPGYVNPFSSLHSWSTPITAESFSKPLSILERGLSHIKITYQPEHPLEAKAYLGFIHKNLTRNSTENNNQALNLTASQSENSGKLDQSRLNHAIEAATRFLISARNQKGWWRDFYSDVQGRISDEWVTAYIGAVLAALPDEQAKFAAHQAWVLLLNRRQQEPGWGYNAFIPPDADSTAWTLHLANALGEMKSHRVQAASQFIAKHFSPTGGIITYSQELVPRGYAASQYMINRFTSTGEKPSNLAELARAYTSSVSVRGWCGIHTCVTAAVAGLEEIGEASLDFLKNTQQDNGSWKAYWWYDHEYATALAAEALAKNNYRSNYQQVELAIEWAADRISPSGAVYSRQYAGDSAFATAWCVRTLALAQEQHRTLTQLHKAVNWLLDNQKVDGSWHSSALLRLPESADILDPDNHPSHPVPDDRRVFTTATVLAALSAVRTRYVVRI